LTLIELANTINSVKVIIKREGSSLRLGRLLRVFANKVKSSQVNTLPKAKSKTRSKQNKDMHKCSSMYIEREVPLPVLTSGGE
jgi:hypothetical protein